MSEGQEREREERQESENTNKINQGKLCTIHLPFRQFADTAWLSLPQMLSPQLEWAWQMVSGLAMECCYWQRSLKVCWGKGIPFSLTGCHRQRGKRVVSQRPVLFLGPSLQLSTETVPPHTCRNMYMYTCVCVCVCVCERERERERESL